MKYLLLLTFLVTLSCDSPPTVSDVTYLRDPRTNLCYADWYYGHENEAVTYVPCTPEVLNLTTTLLPDRRATR